MLKNVSIKNKKFPNKEKNKKLLQICVNVCVQVYFIFCFQPPFSRKRTAENVLYIFILKNKIHIATLICT